MTLPVDHPTVDALWALVAPGVAHLGAEHRARLEARFRAGAAEHGDDWTTWTTERFRKEIQEEHDDLILYAAMHGAALRLRRGAA